MTAVDSEELKEYIKAVITAIDTATKEAGSPHYNRVPDKLVFKLAVVNTSKAEGGIKLWVVKAEGKFQNEQISKLEFEYQASTGRVFLRT